MKKNQLTFAVCSEFYKQLILTYVFEDDTNKKFSFKTQCANKLTLMYDADMQRDDAMN